MWRDSGTIRRRFCPLHPLDGWRVATVSKRMVIRSPMAWCEATVSKRMVIRSPMAWCEAPRHR